jgi:hypothetical protein
MVENKNNISSVITNGDAYFFSYKVYIWIIGRKPFDEEKDNVLQSIELRKHSIDLTGSMQLPSKFVYKLIYYPKFSSVMELKETIDKNEKGGYFSLDHVLFEPGNSKESFELYASLYEVVKGKLYDVDRVLEDIVSNP